MKDTENENMYINKKDANAVGGVFAALFGLALLIMVAIGMSENSYNEQVEAGKDFSAHSQWEEEYTGDSFGEWFDYVFEEY